MRKLKADTIVPLFLAAWWLLNIVQAAFTGLANDESYYWYYSQNLSWGYFDHPPMVALLVWLSSWLPAELGVRFASTLLQPLYLLLFWRLIRPSQPTQRDALVYCLVCFSQPLLQLYGFLALPDAPLMMFTVLFLWAYKRFCVNTNTLNASLMGLSMALLAYSKYHGALVVAFVVLSNPKLLKQWRLYYAAALAVVLILPHLWWQYSHDWVSFRYHLMERNAPGYRINFTLEYLATALAVFNPVWIYYYVKGLKAKRNDFQRALLFLGLGFVLFFLASTLRGQVQAQWLLPAVLPCIAVVYRIARQQKYTRVVGIVCLVLFLAVRVVVMANPFGLKGELWQNKEIYTNIAEVADGRPVQFMHNYTAAAKYRFYTGGESYCAPYYYNRHSQWQYDTTDRTFIGREVLVCHYTNRQPNVITLPNGKPLYYNVVSDFKPMREVEITPLQPLDCHLPLFGSDSVGEMRVKLVLNNPYPYSIHSADSSIVNVLFFTIVGPYHVPAAGCRLYDTIPAYGSDTITATFRLSRDRAEGTFTGGFLLCEGGYCSDGVNRMHLKIKKSNNTLNIKQL